jgi:hypothetical protein
MLSRGTPATTLPAGVRWPLLPRALPRTVTPIQHETYSSYLARLAAANTLDLSAVDALAGYDESDPDCLTRLAALSAQPVSVLLRAMPELRHHQDINTVGLADDGCPTPQTFVNDIRPACRRCAAVAGAAPGTVSVWVTHDRNVCLRHRLWIGVGVEHPDQQIELRGLPDIVHAQIRHRRLLRHRGRDETRAAFDIAEGWWPAITGQPGYTHHRDARLAHAHAIGLDPTGQAWAALDRAVTTPKSSRSPPCWPARTGRASSTRADPPTTSAYTPNCVAASPLDTTNTPIPGCCRSYAAILKTPRAGLRPIPGPGPPAGNTPWRPRYKKKPENKPGGHADDRCETTPHIPGDDCPAAPSSL